MTNETNVVDHTGNGASPHTPFDTTLGERPVPEAAPVAKDDKTQRGGKFLYFVCAVLAIALFCVIAYFVMFGGSSNNSPNIQTTASARRQEDEPGVAKERAINEIKEAVGTPQVAGQPTAGQPQAGVTTDPRAGYDPLNQPVSAYGDPRYGYAPNGTYLNQPIVPSTGPEAAAGAQPTPATSASAGGGSGSGASARSADSAQERPSEPSEPTAPTQTSFYYFNRPRGGAFQTASLLPAAAGRGGRGEGVDAPPVKPPFITRLLVRSQAAISTLTTGSVVTFELLQPMRGVGWSLPRGTIFVGRTSGGAGNRAYIQIESFIDPQRPERTVAISGEVQGPDGAAGLVGQQKRLGGGWVKSLSKAARQAGNAGVSIGTSLLLGRNGGTTSIFSPPQDPFGANSERQQESVPFIYVPANRVGYIFVSDKPPTVQGVQPSGVEGVQQGEMTEAEMIQLMTEGTPEQIRAALPRMNPQMRQAAEEYLKVYAKGQ